VVGALPPRLVVFGIEAARLEVGDSLTVEVAAAVDRAAEAVRGEVLASAAAR
jgi:Ni,Fe-hydrogenase maturation factor